MKKNKKNSDNLRGNFLTHTVHRGGSVSLHTYREHDVSLYSESADRNVILVICLALCSLLFIWFVLERYCVCGINKLLSILHRFILFTV